ncbi:hypothetical protein L7F22_003374 [Adiantum nelumboides]|nr:hypothetical protein [Adiantum nelumboides]
MKDKIKKLEASLHALMKVNKTKTDLSLTLIENKLLKKMEVLEKSVKTLELENAKLKEEVTYLKEEIATFKELREDGEIQETSKVAIKEEITKELTKAMEVQRLPSVFITFAAWSLTEIVRYPQYALSIVGLCPWWLTWLRYSVFIPLYPIGALCGEVLLYYQALPYIKLSNLYDNLFSKLPYNYYNFVLGGLILYPFLWLSLYAYMFKQRQIKLGKRLSGKRTSRRRSD